MAAPSTGAGARRLVSLFLAARRLPLSGIARRVVAGMPAAASATYGVAMSEPTLDVVGIGNALVDVISHESHEFVDAQGLVPGSMNLIDEERRQELYGAMGVAVEASGGSGANTTVGVASLGGTSHYLGRVRDDQLGAVFHHDIGAAGVGYTNGLAPDGPPTGCCLILVTPDGQRTMNTYLGASTLFGPEDVDDDVVRSARYLYLEGYLFDPPAAKAAFHHAADVAHAAGRTVALTLSDSFCVDRHRADFRSFVAERVDLLFANWDKAEAVRRLLPD